MIIAYPPDNKAHTKIIHKNFCTDQAIKVGVNNENTAVKNRTNPYENPVIDALTSTG